MRTFALLLLGVTLGLLACVAAFNAIVDPTAQLGTGLFDPIAQGPRDRASKVELLEQGAVPTVVVFGSSRSKKLDPAWLVQGEGERGVNGAVVGGDMFEARVLAAILAKRSRTTGAPFPQLVVGVDVEAFRDSSLQGSGFLDVPSAATIARREAGDSSGSVSDELERYNRLLLTAQVSKASLASLRARVGGTLRSIKPKPTLELDEFNERGIPKADAKWFGPAVGQLARRTPGKIQDSIGEYRGIYDSIGTSPDPDAVDDLRALVRIAHEAGGPPPLLFITPANPAFRRAFDGIGRRRRHATVLALLRRLSAGGDATYIDCAHCIGDAQRNWIDGVHPSPIGAKQLAKRLSRAVRAIETSS
jgi:hypothetical protein